jgi:hypothetical protein
MQTNPAPFTCPATPWLRLAVVIAIASCHLLNHWGQAAEQAEQSPEAWRKTV